MIAERITIEMSADRRQLWVQQAEMSRLLFDCRIIPTGDEPLKTEMTAFAFDRLRLGKISFTPHRTLHAPDVALRPTYDTFLISLQQKGSVVASQDERVARVEPGSFFCIDTARPFEIETGTMQCLSLYVSGTHLRTVIPEIDRYTAVAISGRRGGGAIFRRTIENVARHVNEIDNTGAGRIADAIPHLLALALGSLPEGTAGADDGTDGEHLERIRAYVREHLSDPELSAQRIAGAIGFSVRHVHQLFSREPMTLMKWVWNERLRRCREELASPASRTKTIGEIALSWGFSDVTHFSRAFQNAYHISPREFRERVAREAR
jgi:AraC family transcriptional activator of tynA and feaB